MAGFLSVTKFTSTDFSGEWEQDSKKLVSSLNTLIIQLNSALAGGLTLPENLGVQVLNFVINVPTPWTQVTTFTNAWVNNSSSMPSRYMLNQDGIVFLDGAVKSGTLGLSAFTLPQNMWPSQDTFLPVVATGGTGYMVVQAADGKVIPSVGATTFMGLSSSFKSATQAPVNPLCFPRFFQSQIGNALMVLPGMVQDVTQGTGSPPKLATNAIAWANDNGQIRIDNVSGLLPNRQYNVTAYAFPG